MGGWQRQQTGVSTNGVVDTNRGGRRIWSEALKRQIVAERLEPGSSVSIVARRHDVNANQLFKWRREVIPDSPPHWSIAVQWCRSRLCRSRSAAGLGVRLSVPGLSRSSSANGARVCIRGEWRRRRCGR